MDGSRMLAKQKDVSDMDANKLLTMIIELLAQRETVRLIFEKENKKQ